MTESKLKRAHLFLNFYFSPWGAGKASRWEVLTNDAPLEDNYAHTTLFEIMGGVDRLDWTALEGWNPDAHAADQED